MFCPDWVARAAKAMEPIVEGAPALGMAGCAVYTIVARRRPGVTKSGVSQR